MFQHRSRSQGKASSFGQALNAVLQQKIEASATTEEPSYRPVTLEHCERQVSFCNSVKRKLKRCQEQLLQCLEQPAVRRLCNVKLQELVEHLRSLDLSTRVVLEGAASECYQYLKEHLRMLTQPSVERSLLLNLKLIVRGMLNCSNIYMLSRKRKRELCSSRNEFSMKVIAQGFSKQQVDEIEQSIIAAVEVQASRLTCYNLLEEHLGDAQNSQLKDICRICQSSIGIEQLYDHVQYCQKRHIEKKNIHENRKRIEEFLRSLRKKQAQLHIDLKKQRHQCPSHLPQEDTDRLQVRFHRKLVRYLEYQLNRSRFVTSNNNQEIIALTDIEQLYSRLRWLSKEIRTVYKQFTDLMEEHLLLKNRLKKIEFDFKIDQSRSTMQSLSSLHQQLNSKDWLARHNNSIKVIVTEDDPIDSNRRKIRQRKTYTYSQPIPSANELEDGWKEYCSERHVPSQQDLTSLKFKDFEVLKFLGKGAFGRVYLARRIVTQDLYAMKIVKLEHDSNSPKITDIMNELGIFRKISGDHLVKAAFSFTDGDLHFFLLEYMEGGDFAGMLDRKVYLSQDEAKFYIAEIVLAIEHLHSLNIIHRDLKPHNLVLDSEGHLKLTDFGLSQEGINIVIQQSTHPTQDSLHDSVTEDQNRSQRRRNLLVGGCTSRHKGHIVGTPDYIAPEVLNKLSSNNFTLDWWSLGVIIYEVLVGERPFGAQTVDDVFDNILHHRIEWPNIGYEQDMMTPQAQDLILQLLQPDYTKRLGNSGATCIKSHPFFQGIDWSNIKHATPPLYTPKRTTTTNRSDRQCSQLRKQIESLMKSPTISHNLQRPSLQSLIRFDLLSQQTIRSGQLTKLRQKSQLQYFNHIQQKCFLRERFTGDCY